MMASTLSPATRRGLFDTLIEQERRAAAEKHPGKKKGSGDYRSVVVYECLGCGEQHDYSDDAANCCPTEDEVLLAHEVKVHCPVCDALIGEGAYREATDCCLWKDLDAHTRWAIADKVEAGSTWQEAIASAADAEKRGK